MLAGVKTCVVNDVLLLLLTVAFENISHRLHTDGSVLLYFIILIMCVWIYALTMRFKQKAEH